MKIEKLKKIIKNKSADSILYTQLKNDDTVYLYECKFPQNHICYEVFNSPISPKCIDFEKKIYSKTHFKHAYPSARCFGYTAWTCGDIERATEKYNELVYKKNHK